jgi:hypothetical protein
LAPDLVLIEWVDSGQPIPGWQEGPVTFIVPATLSPESYQDMADRIEIFLRGLKRRSDAETARPFLVAAMSKNERGRQLRRPLSGVSTQSAGVLRS